MTRTRNMQSPIPRTPHLQRLRIQRIIPRAAHNLNPPLDITRKIDFPNPPRVFVLRAHAFGRDGIPGEAAVGGDFDAFGPAPAARVGPAFDADVAAVDDDLFRPGGHDGAADGHFLDLDPEDGKLVVFADLLIEVEVFFALHGRSSRSCQGFDIIQPFDAARADVAQDYDAEGVAVDFEERGAVHFPY